jgi:hypothetical protein
MPPTSSTPRPPNSHRRELDRGSSSSAYESGPVTAVDTSRCDFGIVVAIGVAGSGRIGGGNVSFPV